MKAKMNAAKLLILFFSIFCTAEAYCEKLQIDENRENTVQFFGHATLGGITGTTHQISGYVSWQGKDTLSTSKVHFEVELKTIDTGIGLRNSHLRNKYLETSKYPKAIFDGRLKKWKRKSVNIFEVETEGQLEIHGVSQKVTAGAVLTRQNGTYRATTSFPLDISDFDIKKPRFLLVSMDEKIKLRLVFYLK